MPLSAVLLIAVRAARARTPHALAPCVPLGVLEVVRSPERALMSIA